MLDVALAQTVIGETPNLDAGEDIGPYRLLQKLGEVDSASSSWPSSVSPFSEKWL